MRKVLGLFLGLSLLGLSAVAPVAAQNKKAPVLIKELEDKNPKVRAAAAEDIGSLADVRLADAKSALPTLRAALKDTDPGVRRAVIEALGKVEPDEYPKLLEDTLKTDKDPVVLVSVAAALGQMQAKSKSAIPALIAAYKASPQDAKPAKTAQNPPPPDAPAVRRAILQALGQIEPEPKGRIPFLIEALKDEKDVGVQLQLVNTLGQIGPPAKDSVPVMLDVQKASLAEAAKPPPPKTTKELDPQGLRRAILQAIARIEPDAKTRLPMLIDAVKNDKDGNVRLAAINALAQIGPDAKSAVPAILEAQKSIVGAADPQGLRKAIVAALIKIESEPKELVAMLIDMLKKERDPAVRLVAVTALAEIGPPAKPAVPALLEVQKSATPTPKVLDPQGLRKAVLEALGKIDPEPKDYVPILITAVKTDRDPAVRLTAIKALAQIGPPAKAAVPALQDAVKLPKTPRDQDKEIAKEAEAALEKIQGK